MCYYIYVERKEGRKEGRKKNINKFYKYILTFSFFYAIIYIYNNNNMRFIKHINYYTMMSGTILGYMAHILIN